MKVLVIREASTDDGTFGVLTLENGWSCRTAELPWRDNQRGISCIPEGTYHADIIHSPHLNRDVYLLHDVPGRQEIEIHNGNFAGDASKGKLAQVHGCILLGRSVATIGKQMGVTASINTLNDFMAQTGGEALGIEIRWEAASEKT